MLTTLGDTAPATVVQSGAVELPCVTVGEVFWLVFVVAVAVGVVEEEDPCSPAWVSAYVPPLARTAAIRAAPRVWPRRPSRRGCGRLPGPSGGVGPAGGVDVAVLVVLVVDGTGAAGRL